MQSIYGIDESVVYDRRESNKNSNIFSCYYTEHWFKKEKLYDDKPRENVRIYCSKSAVKWTLKKEAEEEMKRMWKNGHGSKFSKTPTYTLEGEIFYFILEIGYYHYYFEVERYIDNDELILNYTLLQKKRIDMASRVNKAPMSLFPITRTYHDEFKITDSNINCSITNPILSNSWIPKVIEAKEIWENLYEYISSLRDKPFEDTRTNEQHIESHGFDKKISFRHRK